MTFLHPRVRPISRGPRVSLAALFAALAVGAPVATAAPDGGTVNGAVVLAPRADRPKLPERGRGFTKRIKGPLKEPASADPRPQMIVVLTGGPVADGDAKPPRRTARYELVGESFKTDVFAYVAGAAVEIKNDGHTSPILYAVDADDAIEAGPVNPRGVRPVKAPKKALQSLEIRARDSAHLRGRLVAMPHSYFALVKRNGSFSIAGVPAGKWTIRIWYDGGWLKLGSNPTVTVSAKKTAKAPTVKLPVELATEPVAEAN